MNQAFPLKTRSQRTAANRALANRDVWNLELHLCSEAARSLQVSRLEASLHCSKSTANTLAHLVYGEGRES